MDGTRARSLEFQDCMMTSRASGEKHAGVVAGEMTAEAVPVNCHLNSASPSLSCLNPSSDPPPPCLSSVL